MDLPARLTSTQKGKVNEYLVAASILLASSGRLSPFVPISDDHGIDLIALDKVSQRSICLQVKSAVASAKRKTVQFDVQKSTFRPVPNLFLLGVLFEPTTVSVGTSWLIPMTDVPSISVDQPEHRCGQQGSLPAISARGAARAGREHAAAPRLCINPCPSFGGLNRLRYQQNTIDVFPLHLRAA